MRHIYGNNLSEIFLRDEEIDTLITIDNQTATDETAIHDVNVAGLSTGYVLCQGVGLCEGPG